VHSAQGAWTVPVNKAVVVGEEGFFLLRYTGPELTQPIQGDYTAIQYRFHERRLLYVDKRDAVYMLAPDMEIV
jgi:hypothetical protein